MALPLTHLIDELATAYIQAVAAAAGAVIAVNRDYGVDGTLKHIVRTTDDGYVESGYPVDFQLKGTARGNRHGDVIPFDLNARNYNLIVGRPEKATPYYLFLVCFDAESENWMRVDTEKLVVNASAFWWRQGAARTENVESVRIEIPLVNRLTSITVGDMLRDSQERFAHD
jgi:Domain of unknown function (DUF4365)